ncbi:MAG: hypothetical protein KGJ60_00185 [Verrucomicrobiota bacterium]|nr:hypothetical protein [Verrucomicrobiota bacterium]
MEDIIRVAIGSEMPERMPVAEVDNVNEREKDWSEAKIEIETDREAVERPANSGNEAGPWGQRRPATIKR